LSGTFAALEWHMQHLSGTFAALEWHICST